MINDRFPDVVRIESSGSCNFRCKHCCNSQKAIKRGILSYELFLHLMKQFKVNNKAIKRGILSYELFFHLMKQFKVNNFIPRVMVFYHGGEPLLNKNIYDFIKFAKEYGVSHTKHR